MTATAETFGFFRSWLSDPRRVAAVAPSGKALADLITAGISPETGPVIELGPGTGVFTRALIARGVRPENLVLIEFGADFAGPLRARFPAAHVVQMDAAKLRKLDLPGQLPAGAVVSGLPLLSMPLRKVVAILDGAFSQMRPGASFYQFTYGPRCPIPRPVLDRLGLKASFVGHRLANIPPASVYRIRQRAVRPYMTDAGLPKT